MREADLDPAVAKRMFPPGCTRSFASFARLEKAKPHPVLCKQSCSTYTAFLTIDTDTDPDS